MKFALKRTLACAALALAFGTLNGTAVSARTHRHARHFAPVRQQQLDLSPVVISPYSVSTETDPKLKAWKSKMNLEDGIAVKGTRYITDSDVTSRELFVLQITQSLEGGFDSVNLYDRGILSWGIMQWASHSGSLDHALLYIKNRLQQEHREALWRKLFAANGLDVQAGKGLEFYGKAPRLDLNERRVMIRGSAVPGKFDPKTADHWAMVLARAGRQPEIQTLEIEYAGKVVDGILGSRLQGLPYHLTGRSGLSVEDLVAGNPYAAALVFVLWTNNPRHAWQYVADSARVARKWAISDDPSLWPSGAFADALLRRCKDSRFGNWQRRASMIEARAIAVRVASAANLTPFERQYQSVLATRKVVRAYELASRHLVEQRNKTLRLETLSKTANQSVASGSTPLPDERRLTRAVLPTAAPQSPLAVVAAKQKQTVAVPAQNTVTNSSEQSAAPTASAPAATPAKTTASGDPASPAV